MRSLSLVLACTLLLGGCAATTPDGTPIVPLIGKVAADCTKTAVRETGKDILSEIEFDLVQENWKSLLLDAARKFGEEAIACVIDYIINQSRLDKMASSDKNARMKVERGETWFKERNITIEKK